MRFTRETPAELEARGATPIHNIFSVDAYVTLGIPLTSSAHTPSSTAFAPDWAHALVEEWCALGEDLIWLETFENIVKECLPLSTEKARERSLAFLSLLRLDRGSGSGLWELPKDVEIVDGGDGWAYLKQR